MLAVPLVAASCLAMSFPAMADESIDYVSLYITSDIVAGEPDGSVDVEVDDYDDGYYVEDVEITNMPSDEWDDGDKPRIRVTLMADDDYRFSSIDKGDVDLSGDGGSVTSVSRSSDERSNDAPIVHITLARLDSDDDGDYDLDITDVNWDEDDGTAYWEEPEDAERYEVRLYCDGDAVTSVKTTTDDSYDFSSEFTGSGDYYFRVRAVYNSSNKGSWEESDVLSVSSSEARDIRENGGSSSSYYSSGSSSGGPGVTQNASTGAWLLDSVGWWYCNPDKTYPVNQWQYIDNYWYYFNESGYMVTGWVYWNNKWYYCSDSGAMLANTTTPDGYYVGADGAWIQ